MTKANKTVKMWANKIGYKSAVGRLISQGVSARAAEKLCAGEYTSEPKALRKVLSEEMAKDGVILADEAS